MTTNTPTKMHGISVKLSVSAVTAALVGLIEAGLSHWFHITLAPVYDTELAVLVGLGVGALVKETAIITKGEITVTNDDTTTPATLPDDAVTAAETPTIPAVDDTTVTAVGTVAADSNGNTVTNDNGNIVLNGVTYAPVEEADQTAATN